MNLRISAWDADNRLAFGRASCPAYDSESGAESLFRKQVLDDAEAAGPAKRY